MDDFGEHIKEEYHCPECDALLTRDEKEALKILQGE
jgi:hypothetical protein